MITMDEFTIDKEVPYKKTDRYYTSHQGRPYRYPFEKLELGDSFLIPLENDTIECYKMAANSLTSCRSIAQKKLNIKMMTRKVIEGSVIGIRVWRVN